VCLWYHSHLVSAEEEMINPVLRTIIDGWRLPNGGPLLPRIEDMIHPALTGGHFGSSATLIVGGIQYHLGGERDTRALANLASLTAGDDVLDICCFLGGPAVQLAQSLECRVTGIDVSQAFVAAASKIARLSGLDHLVSFCAADAASLPFQDERFAVVWSQCSLKHDEAWLREFDRVLARGGRLALTFAIRRGNPNENSPPWTLQDVMGLVRGLGYRIDHAQDITERDIELGWKALDRKLSQRETELTAVLGRDWVRHAHQEFAGEIRAMREGRWGNGRIVATKGRAGGAVASAAPPQPGTAPSAIASRPLDQAGP
jgi:SAM-dependent methyltransferase